MLFAEFLFCLFMVICLFCNLHAFATPEQRAATWTRVLGFAGTAMALVYFIIGTLATAGQIVNILVAAQSTG